MSATDISVLAGMPVDRSIFRVDRLRYRVLPGPHPFYQRNEAAILANWDTEVAANPSLYNGQLVFQSRVTLEAGVLEGEGHLVPYATHLWWRRQADRRGGAHAFAWAVPVSSDGAVIAIRMGPRTANPGMVYCAAGSLEREDIVDGIVDVQANMRREVREETGLDLDLATPDPEWYGMAADEMIMVFRVYRFAQTAEEMLAQIRDHMRHDTEQEIEAAIALTSSDASAHRYSRFMPPILDMVLGDRAGEARLHSSPGSGTLGKTTSEGDHSGAFLPNL